MELFVNDKKINLIEIGTPIKITRFQYVIKAKPEITTSMLKGRVLLVNPSTEVIKSFVEAIQGKSLRSLRSMTMMVPDVEKAFAQIKKEFKIIKAAGGIVRKDDEVLLIYRFSKWDLPKGKLDKGEKIKNCAIREVEEECNIKVTALDQKYVTYHTYTENKKRVLKETHWYVMDCIDDSGMKPQKEEGIDHLEWMTYDEVKNAMRNSYKSIKFLLKKYYSVYGKNALTSPPYL